MLRPGMGRLSSADAKVKESAPAGFAMQKGNEAALHESTGVLTV